MIAIHRLSFLLVVASAALSAPAQVSGPHSAGNRLDRGMVGGGVWVVRDSRGMPHVFASSDEGAYFGLGYACAEDRFFQMTLNRLLIYGQMAETFGADAVSPGDDAYLHHDRLMRAYGYRRLAQKLFAQMDGAGKQLLQAYADGVNRFLFPQSGQPTLHPFFAAGIPVPLLGTSVPIPVKPWKPEDSIAVWLRISRLYTPAEPDGAVGVLHTYEAWLASGGSWQGGIPVGGDPLLFAQLFPPRVFDPGSAPVPELIDPLYEKRVDEVAAMSWLLAQSCPSAPGPESSGGYYNGAFYTPDCIDSSFLDDAIDEDPEATLLLGGAPPTRRKFSHAWAVAGNGSDRPAVLQGDPRIEVRSPNEFWEASMWGASFSARGATIPGSPNFVVGSNGHVSWSPTAVGLMQADMYELVVDPLVPDHYLLDGTWVPMQTASETILVRQPSLATSTVVVQYRESVFGPVITRGIGDDQLAVPAAQADEEFAARWVPFHAPASEPTKGFLAIYQVAPSLAASLGKTTAQVFLERLGGWTWPGANLVFADVEGRVGYSVVGALPLRSCLSVLGGQMAQDGSTLGTLWPAIVPSQFMPWIIKEPRPDKAVSVHSANNAPVDGPWYPIPLVSRGGDTTRSRRLREILPALPASFDPEQAVFPIHEDGVWTHARDLVRLGRHLRYQQAWPGLSPEAALAIEFLTGWADPAGNAGLLTAFLPGESALARFVGLTPFRAAYVSESLLDTYGLGDAGLSYFLRDLIAQLQLDPSLVLSDDQAAYIDRSLKDAWLLITATLGSDPASWASWYLNVHLHKAVTRWDSLESIFVAPSGQTVSFPPLLSTTIPIGPVEVASPHTLFSQLGQTYSQWIEMPASHALVETSLLALGQSELPASPHALDQLETWATGPGQDQVFAESASGLPSQIESVQFLYFLP